jgi:hypothetical protein
MILSAPFASWRRLGWRAFLAFCLAWCAVLGGACSKTVRVTLDRSEIQQRVNEKFPVERQLAFSKVTLDTPEVILSEGSDRIGLDLRAHLQAPMLPPSSATITVTGKLSYRPDQRAFYLAEAKIDRLQVEGVPAQFADQARAPIESVAHGVFDAFPVYQLQGRNLQEVTAAHLLREVTVKDGKLQATFGL